jgi:hypothetical protein
LQKHNVVFQLLPDLVWRFDTEPSSFGAFLVEDHIEEGILPGQINFSYVVFIQGFLFGLLANLLNFFLMQMQFKVKYFGESDRLEVDVTKVLAGLFHDSLPVAFLDSFVAQLLDERDRHFEAFNSGSQFDERSV